MGGRLFPICRRIDIDEYIYICFELTKTLNENGFDCKIPKHLLEKKSFGDIDIVTAVDVNNNKNKLRVLLTNIQDPTVDIKVNGPIISFLYRKVQIDVITTNPQLLDFHYNYLCYGDLGILIGKLARQFDFKYGIEGLEYVEFSEDRKRILNTYFVSSDFFSVLYFLGFDVKLYMNGFNTISDLKDFLLSSKYMNKDYLNCHSGNRKHRLRELKRPVFLSIFDSIKKAVENTPWIKEFDEIDFKFKDLDGIESRIYYLQKVFPKSDILDSYTKIKYIKDMKNKIKEKFNGKIVLDILNIKPPMLPFVIKGFKENIKKIHIDFGSYIIKSDPETIKNDLINFYNSNESNK